MRYFRVIVVAAVLATLVTAGFWFHAHKTQPTVAAPTWTPVSVQRMSHGRFQDVVVYIPHDSPRGFVLLLSGSDGWTAHMDDMAKHIAAQGAMVTGIDDAKLDAVLAADGAQCEYPDGDLENLSHFVQAYFRLPSYLSPILAGYSAGATMAYAALAQSPKNTFAGALSFEFCPNYDLSKPLCKGVGLEFTPHPQGKGVDFLPAPQIGNSWTVVQHENSTSCDLAVVRSFVAKVPGAQWTTEPGATSANDSNAWTAQDEAAFDALMAQHPPAVVATVPSVLSDLPIVTVPAKAGAAASGNTFAIILSGDGGWAGLDKDVAGALSDAGIPVIGLDSLRYFWSARTPAGLAADLDRMAHYYSKQLGKQRLLLIGYSQGADVLPFAVNRLSEDTRSQVGLTAVMGMSEHALFEFHMSSWVSDDDSGPATLPEVDRITGIPVLCIYGDEETDTLCPKLDPHKATIVKLKGGHHFDGDYAGLARIILASAKSP